MEDVGMKKEEVIPSQMRSIDNNVVVGSNDDLMKQNVLAFEFKENNGDNKVKSESSDFHLRHHTTLSESVSMPPSPTECHLQNVKKVAFGGDVELDGKNVPPTNSDTYFYSQPIPTGIGFCEAFADAKLPNRPVRNTRADDLKDERYNSFKTWSGRLENQLSALRGKPPSETPVNTPRSEVLPVHRYFDALEGPELDTLRPSEEIILPDDQKWPFLLRYPISSFGMCLGVSSQAIMWKSLALASSTHFLHITPKVNLILWCISVVLFTVVATTYLLKIILYFEAVRREYFHPIQINFFFAPWIALLFLAIGVPPTVATNLPRVLWYFLMAPIFLLELKIYGQWMSGGERRLSKVANPSNHLSVVGNFVGALLGATMGLKEGPIFFFAVGMAHYMVLFVTLYQRLPTNETLPKELHPVFFLFVAAPSVASMAWARINGSFDYGARLAYFVALFLYFSLFHQNYSSKTNNLHAVRVNFFRGFKFSLAWWAYTFPMTGAAIATIRYMTEVSNIVTKSLAITLSIIATITVTGLLVTTILHAFVMKDLFPNHIAIAISDQKPKPIGKWFHRRSGSSEKHIQQFLKFVTADVKDVEVAVIPATGEILPKLDVESQSPLPKNV